MYQASETAQEFMRARFEDEEASAAAEQIAERWTSELVLEDEESGIKASHDAAERLRQGIITAIAALLTKELTRFDLANNGERDFEQWMEDQS